MNTTLVRKAIILRGPPAAGKSTLETIILERRPGCKLIKLDEGWSPGQFRNVGGPNRYSDVRDAQESLVLLTLACGEPSDLHCWGSTRAADEWVKILIESGRQIFPFLLVTEIDDAIRRIDERWKGGHPLVLWKILEQVGTHTLYAHGHRLFTLPKGLPYEEVRIITTGRPASEVADEIIQKAGL